MQRNTNYKPVTAIQMAMSLAISPYFKIGYISYIKNMAYDYDIEDRIHAIQYSRGRSFAIYCSRYKLPRATWRAGKAANTVIDRIISSIRYYYIV
jgi:hypothetical protein